MQIQTIFSKPRRAVSRIFLHCSASDNPAHDNIQTIRKWHIARGFSNVGYHYFIRKNGEVHTGRPLSAIPAAQKGNNTGTIAICLHGLAVNNFTKEQKRSLKALCGALNEAYEGKITFHGHKEVSNKTCPVFDYRNWLNLDTFGRMLLTKPKETKKCHTNYSESQSPSLLSLLYSLFQRLLKKQGR